MSKSSYLAPAMVFLLGMMTTLGAGPIGAAPVAQTHVLPNGFTLVTREEHSRPLISVCLVVKGGSRTETEAVAGLSHYYEHLIFRGGSARQKQLEYRQTLQRLGEEMGYTSSDCTAYGFTVPRDNFDQAWWRSLDAWLHLELDPEKIEAERQVVLEEFFQYRDRPDMRIWDLLSEIAYVNHPYMRPIIGRKEVISHVNPKLMKSFAVEHYVPSQMIMAVVGDFSTPQMVETITRALGNLPPGRASLELGQLEPPQTAFRESFLEMETGQDYGLLGFHVPGFAHPDTPALLMTACLLGQGRSSRLYRGLKIEKDLALAAGAALWERRDPTLLVVELEMLPEKEAEVIKETFAQLSRLAKEPVEAEELERIRTQLVTGYMLEHETYSQIAQSLCNFAALASVEMEPYHLDNLRRVSADDIMRVAQEYLRPENATLAMIRPQGAAKVSFREAAQTWGGHLPDRVDEKVRAPGEVLRTVLPNGLVILARSDYSTPTAAVVVMARGGQWLEPEGKIGVALFTTRMLLRGTARHDAAALAAAVDDLGLRLDTTTGADYATLQMEADASRLEAGLRLVAEILTTPSFTAAEMEKVREDLLAQVRSLSDRPYDLTNREFLGRLYKRLPYRHPLEGEVKDLQGITAEDLFACHRATFVPNQMVVVANGAIDAERIVAILKEELGNLPAGGGSPWKVSPEDPPRALQGAVIPLDRNQVTFNLGFLGPPADAPDVPALRVALDILSRRLFFTYVYEKSLAYRMWLYTQDRAAAAPIMAEMGVSPENFAQARQGIVSAIDRFLDESLSEEELREARQRIESSYRIRLQTNAALAERMARYEILGLGHDYVEVFLDRIREIDADQVKSAARRYLDPERCTLVVVGSPKSGALDLPIEPLPEQ